MRRDVLILAADLARREEPFVLATVVRRQPASSARQGDMAVITAAGEFHGWLGGSCTRPTVVREALRALADGRPALIALSPDPEADRRPGVAVFPMTCHSGGTVDIYVEPVLPAPALRGLRPGARRAGPRAPGQGHGLRRGGGRSRGRRRRLPGRGPALDRRAASRAPARQRARSPSWRRWASGTRRRSWRLSRWSRSTWASSRARSASARSGRRSWRAAPPRNLSIASRARRASTSARGRPRRSPSASWPRSLRRFGATPSSASRRSLSPLPRSATPCAA